MTETAVDVVELPAASSATAVSETAPFVAFVVSQLTVNGAAVTLPSEVVPSEELDTRDTDVVCRRSRHRRGATHRSARGRRRERHCRSDDIGCGGPEVDASIQSPCLTADARREVQRRGGLIARSIAEGDAPQARRCDGRAVRVRQRADERSRSSGRTR